MTHFIIDCDHDWLTQHLRRRVGFLSFRTKTYAHFRVCRRCGQIETLGQIDTDKDCSTKIPQTLGKDA